MRGVGGAWGGGRDPGPSREGAAGLDEGEDGTLRRGLDPGGGVEPRAWGEDVTVGGTREEGGVTGLRPGVPGRG